MGRHSDERARCVLVLSSLAAKYGIARIPRNAGRSKVTAFHRQLQTKVTANRAHQRTMDKAMADYTATWPPPAAAASAPAIILLAILPLILVSKLNCVWHREEAIYLGHCTVPEVNQLPPDCTPTLHRNRPKILRRARPQARGVLSPREVSSDFAI